MKPDAPPLEDQVRLLESCVRGIVLELDEQGRYLEVWTHDERLLAAPRAELLGKTLAEVLSPADTAKFLDLIRRVLADRAPHRIEYALEVLGGARWFVAEAFPSRRPRAVVLLVQDFTERKQMEARLVESDRLAAIGLLAGGVGHEINNPLAWTTTHLLALHSELSARARDGDADLQRWSAQLSEALEGAERIRQIVRDLSFFTRSPEEQAATVDLRRAIDWAADMVMAELRHKGRLTKVYDPAPLVSAPEARLGQVFLNLLINAAQSISGGAAEANEVRVELGSDSTGRARIDVVDTGSGIAPEHTSRLFEPFFTTKPRGSGTGLGLSVSRRIIESLSGTLELVSSRAGETRFRVTLPPAAPLAIKTPVPVPRPARLSARIKVLFVDDHPRFLASLQLAMKDTLEVEAETSGRAALARLKNGEQFDAIVCDLMMPDFTGMDLHEAVAAEAPAMAEKMVFMTGGAFTRRAQEFLATIPNPRLEKPFKPEQLEQVLAELTAPAARDYH